MNLALFNISDTHFLDFSTLYSSNMLRCSSTEQLLDYCSRIRLDGLIINASSDWKQILKDLQKQGTYIIPPIFLWGDRRPNVSNLLEMGRLGIEDYLYKAIKKDYLLNKIKENSHRHILQRNIQDSLEYTQYSSFLHMAQLLARKEHNLLLTGETGCGKSYYAKWIHEHSCRPKDKFVSINCPTIAKGIFESELFGSTRGAYTDAIDRSGLLEIAGKGTIFLDEISELTVHQQSKLLTLLEDKEFRRVGSNSKLKLQARFIFASNKRLKKEIKKGRFRKDLYYRINVLPLKIPPLRKRKEEIPQLVSIFLKRLNCKKSISSRAFKLLMDYHWPGNIRQLFGVILRADTLSGSSPMIDVHHISFD